MPPPPSTQHLPKLKVSNQKQEAAAIKQHLAAASSIRKTAAESPERRINLKGAGSDETGTGDEEA